VIVSLNKQSPTHIYFAADRQIAIIGEIIPFGPNPFASVRASLQAADGASRGAGKPAILLVEFTELACPQCKAAQPILEKLAADFPQVRLVYQPFPLPAPYPCGLKAAGNADCAGRMDNNRFWKYVDSVFENQAGIASADADDQLRNLASSAGLDAARMAQCATAPETAARLRKSVALGEELRVTQVPTVFINGRRVLGIASIPYEQLKTLVRFEINHAGK
jgi:protein-disulfide isomerase